MVRGAPTHRPPRGSSAAADGPRIGEPRPLRGAAPGLPVPPWAGTPSMSPRSPSVGVGGVGPVRAASYLMSWTPMASPSPTGPLPTGPFVMKLMNQPCTQLLLPLPPMTLVSG